jgi:hypothetical protein
MARLAGPDIDGPITALRGLPFVAGFGQLSGNLERKRENLDTESAESGFKPGSTRGLCAHSLAAGDAEHVSCSFGCLASRIHVTVTVQ